MWDRFKLGTLGYRRITVLAVLSLGACATPRTQFTDKSMQVLIDPESVSADHYVAIQRALFDSGRFFVVDRAKGFKAVKVEQEREHQTEGGRFIDREKLAHWGKLYGVGGIVVGHAECSKQQGMIFGGGYDRCRQYLSIVDSNTGEVIVAVEGQADSSDDGLVPSWDGTVKKLVSKYPTHFKPNQTSTRLEEYKALSAEEAQRAREIAGEK